MSRGALVLGASGSVGEALLRRLVARSQPVAAWSRRARQAHDISWHVGDLFTDTLPHAEAVFSAGPLDGLVAALSRSPLCDPSLIVALSSSSATFKQASLDANEQALAERLKSNEALLEDLCHARGARCLILRPTLIYGGDDAAHFGAVSAQARRLGFIVLPADARGMRMPIHAEDLSATMLNALDRTDAQGVFDVGGGETLGYDAMLERVLRARGLRPRVLRVPGAMFRAALGGAHRVGALHGLTAAIVARMRQDLVVDDSEARRALGHAPGPFRPAPA